MNFHSPILTLTPIDRGVPLPPPKPLYQRKYPFRDMRVGDSFFAPGKTRQQLKTSIRYATCECRQFTTRRVTENGVTGLRVWRIA